MCKTDDKVKFIHNWQAWQKVMPRAADNLALSAADHPPNFAPDILMIFFLPFLAYYRLKVALLKRKPLHLDMLLIFVAKHADRCLRSSDVGKHAPRVLTLSSFSWWLSISNRYLINLLLTAYRRNK